jgi:hypothetical protein
MAGGYADAAEDVQMPLLQSVGRVEGDDHHPDIDVVGVGLRLAAWAPMPAAAMTIINRREETARLILLPEMEITSFSPVLKYLGTNCRTD